MTEKHSGNKKQGEKDTSEWWHISKVICFVHFAALNVT